MTLGSAPDAGAEPDVDVAIVGSGFAGLCMAIRLQQAGRDDFVVLEEAGEVGGTWRDNTYPGCACDVPSHLYSFSFAQNPRWSRAYAPQSEIQAYLEDCATRFAVRPHIRFRTALTKATYDEAASLWRLETSTGERIACRILVSAIGGLSRPAYPKIPGRDRFRGRAFHTQRWDHGYDLKDKRVAVIGTGASAIQVVPRIAPIAGRLHVFQRTPPWIVPRPDRPITRLERQVFTRLSPALKAWRALIYGRLEWRALAFTRAPWVLRLVERQARRHLRRQVPDPELRRALTPDYTFGCKRVLLADDYYPALIRPNVEVVTAGIREITPGGIVTEDGRERPVDAIVYGTGFRATDPLPEGVVHGRGGLDLTKAWAKGAVAYKGTVVSGFPNLFILTGPNTGLGHTSMVLMIESQVRYVMGALEAMAARDLSWVEVRRPVQDRYDARLQARMGRTVWSLGGCRSWYVDPRSGRNTTLWPGFTWQFMLETRRFDLGDYRVGVSGKA